MAEVVGYTGLSLAQVGGFGHPPEVEEFGKRAEGIIAGGERGVLESGHARGKTVSDQRNGYPKGRHRERIRF